jgi:hypothetical protein
MILLMLEDTPMRTIIGFAPFALLLAGTLGLLLNEFVLDWGRPATLVFAAANVIGLLTLGLAQWARRGDK